MDADLDTLATALYVTIDDLVRNNPNLLPPRPRVSIDPQVSDAELVTMAVVAMLLRVDNESRWVRYCRANLRHLFPYIPLQPGYNKRLRKLPHLMLAVMRHLIHATWASDDDLLLVDSTPIECGRSRETAKRSDLAGIAEYGYCASHSRYFWGMRLHLITTRHGLPITFALTGAKADERQVLLGLLDDPCLTCHAPATLAADGFYYGKELETGLAATGFTLLRKPRGTDTPEPEKYLLGKIRMTIESVFDTLKDQLTLEHHHALTLQGLCVRVAQRLLALTTAIWHNANTGQPVLRSLTAYDH